MMLRTCCECKEFKDCEVVESKAYKGRRTRTYICWDCYRKLCKGVKHDKR